MQKKYPYFLLLGSFLLPFTILIVLWTVLGLAPFGNHNLLVSDLGTQYMPFLSAFKQFFETGNHLFYSFSNAIGDATLPLIAYYLISPFNFLVLFFSYEQLPIAILFIITLKISFMGTSMFYYLKQSYRTSSIETLFFSTAYSLCGFVTVYSLNFMWLDALIFLPLIILGMQRLWSQKKYWLYSLSLFGAIVTNYYLGYMICIFAVLYSIYYWFSIQTTPFKFKQFMQFFKESKLFFVVSILTGIATSFVLLPAAQGMLQTKKSAIDLASFMPSINFGSSFFSQFGIGTINFDLRLEHLPTIFSGILIGLLVLVYFQLPSITKKSKWAAGCLLLAIFLSFWVKPVNIVWHMFQEPAGFPYRNSFIFSFLLIKFAYEAFLHLKKGEKVRWYIPVIFSVLLSIGYLALIMNDEKQYILSPYYYFISLGFIWLFFGLLLLSTKKQKSVSFWAKIFLMLLLSIELGTNFWISLKDIPFGSQDQFEKNFTAQRKQLATLDDQNQYLFRLNQQLDSTQAGYNEKNNGYNNAILYGYAGISNYSSTLNADSQSFLQSLGLYGKNDRRIAYVDHSKVANLLLNIKYSLEPKPNHPDQTVTTLNREAIGMGFLAPKELSSLKLDKEQPLDNQEAILQQLLPISTPYFKNANVNHLDSKATTTHQTVVTTTASGDLHLYIPGLNWKNVTEFTINGEKKETPIYIATKQLYNLGYFKKGEAVTLTLKTKKEMSIDQWDIRSLDQQLFQQVVDKQEKQAIELTKKEPNYLSGTITVTDSDAQLLYLAIPFDKNWQVKVDGTVVSTAPLLKNMTGVELSQGKHTISIHYQPKSFYIGSMISLSVIFGTLVTQFVKKRRIKS